MLFIKETPQLLLLKYFWSSKTPQKALLFYQLTAAPAPLVMRDCMRPCLADLLSYCLINSLYVAALTLSFLIICSFKACHISTSVTLLPLLFL